MPLRRNASKKTRRSPKTSKGKMASIARSVVKSELNKTVELKDNPYGLENQQLYHNVPLNIDSNIFYTTQGLTDPQAASGSNRIGDSVYFKSLTHKLWLANKLDRPNLMYRVTIVYRKTTAGTVPTSAPYVSVTNNGNIMLSDLNMENGQVAAVLYDKVFTYNDGHDISSGGSTKESHHLVQIFRRLNTKCTYYGDNATVPKAFTPQLWVTAYDSYGTLISDNVASCGFQRHCRFTDA